jgi:hypothetical protein
MVQRSTAARKWFKWSNLFKAEATEVEAAEAEATESDSTNREAAEARQPRPRPPRPQPLKPRPLKPMQTTLRSNWQSNLGGKVWDRTVDFPLRVRYLAPILTLQIGASFA